MRGISSRMYLSPVSTQQMAGGMKHMVRCSESNIGGGKGAT